jgi:MoaA/NifB/PqqE/SkfB family radical SAM enzyme
LFSGACSARCPFCIGQQVDARRTPPNLDEYPPRGLERLIEMIWEHAIPQVVLTGANTDPQLYRHEDRLVETLRRRLPAGTQIALHTNGRQLPARVDQANRYDRVCISFPSFDTLTYRRVMGVSNPPDLAEILRRICIPVKLSCVLTEANRPEMPGFLRRCRDLGASRVVLRKLYLDPRPWEALLPGLLGPASRDCALHNPPAPALTLTGNYHGNPVYDYEGMQVTLWDFARAESRSINLFSNGEVTEEYLLAGNRNTGQSS